jgi:hypothetical protein
MKYNSKLKMPLLLEGNKLNNLRNEMQVLINEKTVIEKKIKEEEEKIDAFHSNMLDGGEMVSSFFNGYYDRIYVLKKEEEIRDIQRKINLINIKYNDIKKKIEKMTEIDNQRKKEYESFFEKKEEKETEELRSMLKYIDERGE